MSIYSLGVNGHSGIIEISGISHVIAQGSCYYPLLNLQVDMKGIVLQPQNKKIPYTVIVLNAQLTISSNPVSHSPPSYLFEEILERAKSWPCHFQFPLDTRRLELIENIRAGGDAKFELRIEGIASIGDTETKPDRIWMPQAMKFDIPQSQWVKDILSKWKYGHIRLIELYFGTSYGQTLLKPSYFHIEKAITHFNNGNDRETLVSVYAAFERMAKKLKCSGPDQNFFDKLLSNIPLEKRQKLKVLIAKFCDYLQLGRHEQKDSSCTINRRDAEFALTTAQMIFVYLSRLVK